MTITNKRPRPGVIVTPDRRRASPTPLGYTCDVGQRHEAADLARGAGPSAVREQRDDRPAAGPGRCRTRHLAGGRRPVDRNGRLARPVGHDPPGGVASVWCSVTRSSCCWSGGARRSAPARPPRRGAPVARYAAIEIAALVMPLVVTVIVLPASPAVAVRVHTRPLTPLPSRFSRVVQPAGLATVVPVVLLVRNRTKASPAWVPAGIRTWCVVEFALPLFAPTNCTPASEGLTCLLSESVSPPPSVTVSVTVRGPAEP